MNKELDICWQIAGEGCECYVIAGPAGDNDGELAEEAGIIHVYLSISGSIYLYRMYVEPAWRRLGVGTKLLEGVETWGRLFGARGMETDIAPWLGEAERESVMTFLSKRGWVVDRKTLQAEKHLSELR